MSKPKIPDPTQAAIAGMKQSLADYPFTYIINALAQSGGKATLIDPATGQPKTYDFTGLGQQQAQAEVSDQMAQVMLDIQRGYGAQFIQQRLDQLKASDPTGYAAYRQLFDQINQEAQQTPGNMPLSGATQQAVKNVLQSATSLTPEEQRQVQQQIRGQNIASGVALGGQAAQQEMGAQIGALGQKQAQAQQAAGQYLAQGISPSDIQYRKIQQDLANYGAFINRQTPLAQFGQLQGAQQGAAPTQSLYQQAQMPDLGQAGQRALQMQAAQYGAQGPNQYLAGIGTALGGIQAGNQLIPGGFGSLFSSSQTPSFSSAQIALPSAYSASFSPTFDTSLSSAGVGISYPSSIPSSSYSLGSTTL